MAAAEAGRKCVLVRWETNPDDLKGMVAAEGILTSHGGKTSHAAVIARGMGTPCVCGVERFRIDAAEKVVHIEGSDRVLHEGDIINVDCSTILDGYFSDSSRMFCIGKVSTERQRLVDVTRASVEAGLAAVKPWLPLSVMAEAVQKTVEDAGFSVVREYGGHGIGKEFHEDPFVGFTTEAPDVDTIMAPGMVFTIEPMVNAGAPDIKISKGDGWCVRTKDGSDSAQCEVQLVVTEDGYELLSW